MGKHILTYSPALRSNIFCRSTPSKKKKPFSPIHIMPIISRHNHKA
jgi:hypothetical protein